MKLIEPQAGGFFGEKEYRGPVEETTAARLDQVGPFLQQNPVASQTLRPLSLGVPSGAGAPTNWLAGRAGSIFGIAARHTATMPTGSASYQATVNGVAAGDAAAIVVPGLQVVAEFPNPAAFAAGDTLGIGLTASALFPTNASIQAHLLVRWAAD